MICRLLFVAALAISLAGGAACGPPIDLAKSIAVTDVLTGWYDWGVLGGQNKLVPSISFRLQNTGTVPLSGIEMTVSYWKIGADGENESKELIPLGTPLAPGASTNLLVVHGDVGFTSLAARAEMLTLSSFEDFTAKLFVKRAGKIVPLGEFKIDRRLLPNTTQAPGTK
jgi:hypothetical protein